MLKAFVIAASVVHTAALATTPSTRRAVGQALGTAGLAAVLPVQAVEWNVTEDGLKFIDLKEGTGAEALAGQTVEVKYTGWLNDFDDVTFDSTDYRGRPFKSVPKSSLRSFLSRRKIFNFFFFFFFFIFKFSGFLVFRIFCFFFFFFFCFKNN